VTGELKLHNEELKDPPSLSNIVKVLKLKGNEYGGSYGVHNKYILPIPVSARSKTWICGFSLAEIVGSKTACGIQCCLFSSRDLCVWLFSLPEFAVSERVCKALIMGMPRSTGGACVTEKEKQSNIKWQA